MLNPPSLRSGAGAQGGVASRAAVHQEPISRSGQHPQVPFAVSGGEGALDDLRRLLKDGRALLDEVPPRVRELLDAAPAKEFEHQVRDLALGVAGVRALDKCRIRKSGTRYFVELHVEVDGRATVQEGHDIGGRVRSALRSSPLRIADAFIHIEPA